MDTVARIKLNAHHDVTNVVQNYQFRDVLVPTLSSFISHLTRICGPFARNTLLIQADESLGTAIGSEMDMRMFMRDGRHVLRSTEYVSPIQQYLKTTVLYLGTRIDSMCKDGTTTSMILAAAMIKALITNRYRLDSYTLLEIDNAFTQVCSLIEAHLSCQKLDIESIKEEFQCTENEAASALAFLQAYTASGGNQEIAIAIADFFRFMPKSIWSDSIEHTVSRVEKVGYVCKAEVYDYEYELPTILMTLQHRNDDLRRTVVLDETDFLIMPGGIADSSFETDDLLAYLKERLDGGNKTPLVIASPGGNHVSQRIVDVISAKAKEYQVTIPVVAYNVKGRATTPWSALAICGKANKPMYQGLSDIRESVISSVSVRIDVSTTRINKLTPVDDRMPTLSMEHPGLSYPDDYPFHKKAFDHVEGYLVSERTAHKADPEELREMESAHADLSVRTRMILRLGGYYHDQLALQPVIEDAAGSAMAVVRDGLICNGMHRLRRAVELAKKDAESLELTSVNVLMECFSEALYETCWAIFGPIDFETYRPAIEQIDTDLDRINVDDPTEYLDIVHALRVLQDSKDLQPSEKQSIKNELGHLVKGDYAYVLSCWKSNGYPPIQTYGMLTELLARLKEVALRTGLTDMIVVPGAAWAPEV